MNRLDFTMGGRRRPDRTAQLLAEIDRLTAERKVLVARIEAMALALLREDRVEQDDWEEGDDPVPFWPRR